MPKKRNGRMPAIEPWQEELLRQKYAGCLTVEDRRELNEELGWGHDTKMTMMYNAASGLDITCGRGGITSPLKRRSEFPGFFKPRDDEYILNAFYQRTVEEIARQRGFSIAAILYRARHLGCRRPAAYWPLGQIADSLNVGVDDILARSDIERVQLDNGQTIVGSCSLVQWFMADWQSLIEGGADEFLLHEIMEGYHDLLAMTTEYERCKYLSAEHVCMNPKAGLQYGHSCTQLKTVGGYEAGENPKCAVRNADFPEQPLKLPVAD
jgi:hypothetical protein